MIIILLVYTIMYQVVKCVSEYVAILLNSPALWGSYVHNHQFFLKSTIANFPSKNPTYCIQ